jgi:flagellar biosynthesis protein FlhF
MAEALAQVKDAMGNDAVILHTRTFRKPGWLGLRWREVVEITAGKGLNVGSARRRTTRPVPPLAAPQPSAANYLAGAKQLLDTPVAQRAIMVNLSEQVESIRTMVKDLSTQVRHQQKPQVPEELFDHYLQLVSSHVCDELAVRLVTNVYQQIRPEHRQKGDFVRDRIVEQIEKLLTTAGPIRRTKSVGPHVVALIGPTGVGKTTTIAKLAANLKLHEKRRVGLITIDTYRIAAVEQLKKYADIIGSNLRIVASPDELKNAVASMSDCEHILIDTAGRSPKDALKIHELKNFLASAVPDETHLVLTTTAAQECIELAIERFSEVPIDRLIFTKLDEAPHVGVVLNILHKVNKPLSYLTTGQTVPDAIEVGQSRRLAQLILGHTL